MRYQYAGCFADRFSANGTNRIPWQEAGGIAGYIVRSYDLSAEQSVTEEKERASVGSREEQHNQQKMKRMQKMCKVMPIAGGVLAVILGAVFLIQATGGTKEGAVGLMERLKPEFHAEPIVSASEQFPDLDIQEEFLTVNPYSRPGTELKNVKKIVIHYTANPGTSAQANRDYFEGLATTQITSASSHFIIGLDGEIIQCVPLNEVAYASNEANSYSLSIECCHPDESGEFATVTYNQCVALTAELCKYYHLDPETDVIRHYDVTGKECPLYYVENPQEWEMFLGFVKDRVS